jgi:hypothetical protein
MSGDDISSQYRLNNKAICRVLIFKYFRLSYYLVKGKMDDFNEQVFEMIGRLRQNGLNRSKAAAVIKAPCDMIVSDNPDRNKSSKAASPILSSDEELIASAPPGEVPSRIRQQILQTAEGPTKVTSYEYELQGSSSSTGTDLVYKCGTHDFETKNLKEFNNHIHKTHNEGSTPSKAASVTSSANKAKEIHGFS